MKRAAATLLLCLAALPALAQGRQFGETNAGARIRIEAQDQSWVRIRDAEDKTVFMRVMQPGDSYLVPNRSGLLLDTGNGRALSVLVDGAAAPSLVPPAGSIIRRNIALDPALLSGAAGGPTLPVPPPAIQPAPEPVRVAAVAAASPVRAAITSPRLPPAVPPTDAVATAAIPLSLEVAKGSLLRLRQAAATVFVADPDVADIQVKSPALVYVFGRRAGETVLYAVDEQERVLLATRVVVNHNLTGLQNALKAMMPDADIEASSVENTLILTGTVASAAQAENARRLAARFAPEAGAVLNQIQVVAPNQINLRVRVVEVSRTTVKELGINWDGLMSVGSFAFGVAAGGPVAAGGALLTRNNSALGNGTTNSLTFAHGGNRFDVNAVIDALSAEGMITVLAEPNLTALGGETASFLAGGEFPIPVPQNNNNITIEFKKFGVGLAFTPTLLDGDRINLKVRPEVSQLSSVGAIQVNNFSIPALTTRRAETTVELGSGQSFAIAGLLQNNSQQDINKVPLLGDIPVIGPLFRSDRFRRNETELVIIATPYIVRPVSAKQMATPLDGMTPPTDLERIVMGANYRQQTGRPAAQPLGRNGQGLQGSAGFILE
jgi:pilus assembly protein CpaC